MWRNIFLLFFVLLAGQAQANSPFSGGTEITFEVEGMPAGWCRIIGMLGNQNYLVDTIQADASGKATFRKATPLEGGLYYFVFPDQRTFLQFLVDKDQTFTLRTKAKNIVSAMQVSGSEDNQLFYKNMRFEEEFKVHLDSVDQAISRVPATSPSKPYLNILRGKLLESRKDEVQKYAKSNPEAFFTYFKLSGQNPVLTRPLNKTGTLDTLQQLYQYRLDYWKNTALDDERLLRTPVIFNKLKTFITQLTPQNADSIIKYGDYVIDRSLKCKECFKFISNWIAIEYEKPTFLGGDAILVHLVDKYFTDERAFWYKDTPRELAKIRKKVNEMRPSLMGNIGQDLRCKNTQGQYENLYDLKTPYKILFMYSYSCHHCQERAPLLQGVKQQLKGVADIYALCLDPEIPRWKAFLKKYNMTSFHNVIDPNLESRYYRKYHVDITPELYILDPNNKIIGKNLHPDQVVELIQKDQRHQR